MGGSGDIPDPLLLLYKKSLKEVKNKRDSMSYGIRYIDWCYRELKAKQLFLTIVLTSRSYIDRYFNIRSWLNDTQYFIYWTREEKDYVLFRNKRNQNNKKYDIYYNYIIIL